MREEILRLWAEGDKSYRGIRNEFNRRHAHLGVSVCVNTVYAWVQKYGSEMQAVRCATRNRFPRYAPANLRWCLDGTGKRDAHGETHFIFGAIDFGTRVNLVLERLPQANTAAILASLFRATAVFGTPRVIRTDNASVFRCELFQCALRNAGIRHEFSEPGKPWQNGRIERLFLTLKEKLNQITPMSGLALDSMLTEFSFWYNEVRPHQHLHGFTPAEVWRGINPYLSAPKAVLRFVGWDGLLRGRYLLR